ncbi:MAG: TraU family protein [Gammaproteobacteria bacterium]|nr:TraU family protein [Gammaproteobacteria bacterium]MDH5651259.1 TraU family protein [Gammaproteobacteria bacterium]
MVKRNSIQRVWIAALLIVTLYSPMSHAAGSCGAMPFVNPVTDICWRCIFPLFIGPAPVATMGQIDSGAANGYPPPVCVCPTATPPWFRVGIGTVFWEPARIAEAVRTPWCSPTLGGISLASPDIAVAGRGDNRTTHEQRESIAFYHVHWFVYPVMAWFNMMVNQHCVETEQFDVGFLSELDPMWNNDEMTFILNPEAVLFNNPVAQAACAADCVAASAGFPLDSLFWCLGCQVGLHPLSGTVKPHEGGLASSTVAIQRLHAILHRSLVALNVSTPAAMCIAQPAPIMQKSWYKTQLLRPIPTPLTANPYGRSTTLRGMGKEFPINGEDFSYLIWRRRVCCTS